MDDKHAYVPDVTSFFTDGKKYSVKDIMNREMIEQEKVNFAANDLYAGTAKIQNTAGGYRRLQNCRKKCGRRNRKR